MAQKLIYSGFPRIRNHFFGYNPLFYPLFYMKIEVCFLYEGFLIRGNPLLYMKFLTPEVPSKNATKMCVIHYDY